MRICFITDIRTQHSQRWISYFVKKGYEIRVISTRHYRGADLGCEVLCVPMAFTAPTTDRLIAEQRNNTPRRSGLLTLVQRSFIADPLAELWRSYMMPLEAFRLRGKIGQLLREFQPDICHGIPLPIEGYVAGMVNFHPLIVSTWGQDLINFFPKSFLHSYLTRLTLSRADAYIADCQRDRILAGKLGFDAAHKPVAVFPGNGGVDMSVIHPKREVTQLRQSLQLNPGHSVVLYPRGVRNYVRLDTLLNAIPIVIRHLPQTSFLLMGVQHHHPTLSKVQQLGIQQALTITGYVGKEAFADYLVASDIMVSPSTNDGTSMTLLEAMSCGTFPIVSDIQSNREWIAHGENGFLVDPRDPVALAMAIEEALSRPELRKRAATINHKIISERADYSKIMPNVERFYEQVVSGYLGKHV